MYLHNEPGIFFEDTVERYNNAWWALKMDSTNPCGEICMSKWGACQLGHMFLPSYVNNRFTDKSSFDFESFKNDIALGVRFLDNCIDMQKFPLEQIDKTAKDWRRIGLGFMGLADVFAMMGFKYGSDESKKLSFQIASTLRDSSYYASMELAREKGRFPRCDRKKIVESKFVQKLPDELVVKIRKYGLRNVGINAVAPTGTVSLSIGGNCSSGIEPIFALSYYRNIRTGKADETKKEKVYSGSWLEYIEYMKKQGIKEDVKIPHFFKSTVEEGTIDIFREIDIQSIFQRYIDHSISKTVNLPRGISFDDYKEVFLYAYKKGLKGFTSFNSGGSIKGILEFKDEKKECVCNNGDIVVNRPQELPCDIYESTKDDKKFIVLIGMLQGCPYEIFVGDNTKEKIDVEKNKNGIIRKVTKGRYDLIVIEDNAEKILIEDISKTLSNSIYGTFARFLSMSLRYKVPIYFIVDQLTKDSQFISFERVVARHLKKYIKEGEIAVGKECPGCGSKKLIFSEGCYKCQECFWSGCP
jgi:ribonucleoside-diphosphate reductase alpha chain